TKRTISTRFMLSLPPELGAAPRPSKEPVYSVDGTHVLPSRARIHIRAVPALPGGGLTFAHCVLDGGIVASAASRSTAGGTRRFRRRPGQCRPSQRRGWRASSPGSCARPSPAPMQVLPLKNTASKRARPRAGGRVRSWGAASAAPAARSGRRTARATSYTAATAKPPSGATDAGRPLRLRLPVGLGSDRGGDVGAHLRERAAV